MLVQIWSWTQQYNNKVSNVTVGDYDDRRNLILTNHYLPERLERVGHTLLCCLLVRRRPSASSTAPGSPTLQTPPTQDWTWGSTVCAAITIIKGFFANEGFFVFFSYLTAHRCVRGNGRSSSAVRFGSYGTSGPPCIPPRQPSDAPGPRPWSPHLWHGIEPMRLSQWDDQSCS